MRKRLCIFLFSVFTLISIFPQTALAQSDYICDCATDTLNCSDFASPSDAQACFWYCGALGAGDIHQLDLDMNAVACDVIAQPMAMPTLEPVFIEPTADPISETVYVAPTAVPAYEVCSCGGDYYDCSTFSGPSHAQGCYDYCVGQNFGDIHLMDPDGDGLACFISGAVSAAPISIAPTATPMPYVPPTVAPVYVAPAPVATAMPYVPPTAVPVYVAPTPAPTVYIPPTMAPMAAAPTSTPIPYIIPGLDANNIVVNAASCACDADHYNCSSFASEADAQACFNYCFLQGADDIHRLDQGGIKQVTCENYTWHNTTPLEPVFENFVEFAGDSCTVCTEDKYNCADFSTAGLAQGCFNACRSLGYGDIHGLDKDSDLLVCESRPQSP